MPSNNAVLERAALVDEYLTAFSQANPKSKLPELRFEGGWFYLKTDGYESKHRRKKLESMRDSLLARAKTACAADA